MGIALVTPIDKLLKLIVESEWFEMVEKAARHLSAPLQGSVVLQVDLSTGDLISKVDLARISLPPGAPASTDSPEPIDRIRINRHQRTGRSGPAQVIVSSVLTMTAAQGSPASQRGTASGGSSRRTRRLPTAIASPLRSRCAVARIERGAAVRLCRVMHFRAVHYP